MKRNRDRKIMNPLLSKGTPTFNRQIFVLSTLFQLWNVDNPLKWVGDKTMPPVRSTTYGIISNAFQRILDLEQKFLKFSISKPLWF